jgi:predicted TIM-barrel fold metal-dependent hydrolase
MPLITPKRWIEIDHRQSFSSCLHIGPEVPEATPALGASFSGGIPSGSPDTHALEMAAVGQHIYNQWLVDAVSCAPSRFLPIAQIPMWDVDAAVREATWAGEAGMAGVNFPPQRPDLRRYDDPAWEPFWSVCEAYGMVLASHAGGAPEYGPDDPPWYLILNASNNRRGLHRLIFGGVFERHPGLKLVMVEHADTWWTGTLEQWNAIHAQFPELQDPVRSYFCPRRPSEYAADHMFIGGSFLAEHEATRAIDEGYVGNMMWGRDFPHGEGTWSPTLDDFEPATRLHLRNTSSRIAPEHVKAILGDNAVRQFGLDGAELARIAERIGAPTFGELATPITSIPANASHQAFRVAPLPV